MVQQGRQAASTQVRTHAKCNQCVQECEHICWERPAGNSGWKGNVINASWRPRRSHSCRGGGRLSKKWKSGWERSMEEHQPHRVQQRIHGSANEHMGKPHLCFYQPLTELQRSSNDECKQPILSPVRSQKISHPVTTAEDLSKQCSGSALPQSLGAWTRQVWHLSNTSLKAQMSLCCQFVAPSYNIAFL